MAGLVLGDPLFAHGLTLAVWVVLVVKVVAVFAIVLVSVLAMVMYERKAVAYLGNRPGPNRAGPWGMLQSLADGTKLFFKENFVPSRADRPVYRLAPFLALVPAILAVSVVPIGNTVHLGHNLDTRLQLADPPWGVLFLLMTSSVAVYGVMLAGWASGSKYALLGSVRASAQMVSYESAVGLSVATVVLLTGSLHTSAITYAQQPGFLYNWNIVHAGIIPFVVFFIAITAEMTRAPFDLVEAEEEISGGFNIEYGSVGFALLYLAEYANLVVNAAVIATLWLGGPDGPKVAGVDIGPFWFLLKVFVLLYLFVWIRATLPRLRYDQLMDLGWKRLIPLALAWLMIVAAFQVSRWYGVAAIGGSLLAGGLLLRAIDVGRQVGTTEAAGEAVSR
ncbi:MAG: complex I subunit 1/NuoH family protein [Acidimicrobiales bacterium]